MRRPVDLDRQLQKRLIIIVGVFAFSLSVALAASVAEALARRHTLAEQQLDLARKNITRRLDFYRDAARQLAESSDTQDALLLGDARDALRWAEARLHFIPGVLGIALLDPQAQVLGNAGELHIGDACTKALHAHRTPGHPSLVVHQSQPGLEHFDLTVPVHDVGGRLLGGVFVSLRLEALERLLNESALPGHAIALYDATGTRFLASPGWREDETGLSLKLADTGWQVHVQSPHLRLTTYEITLAGTAGATLLVVLLTMLRSFRQFRTSMQRDLDAVRDSLAAISHGQPLPKLLATYTQFVPAMEEIARIAETLDAQRSELARLSHTDPLTGLANRRALEDRYRQLEGLAQRGHRLALVLLDLDRFKTLNDSLGHAAGDQALIALAHALAGTTRTADFCARLAGDEFVAVLADLDAAGAGRWFARLADRFQAELRARGLADTVTLSAGLTWLDGAKALGSALASADRALYQAKSGGRNQLVFAVEGSPAQ